MTDHRLFSLRVRRRKCLLIYNNEWISKISSIFKPR